MSKWIQTAHGDMINSDCIATITIEDFEMANGVGMIAVANLTTGKRLSITNPCDGSDVTAENYPAFLISVLLHSPVDSIIGTMLYEGDNNNSTSVLIPETFAAYVMDQS
jgi:hypothetical protein